MSETEGFDPTQTGPLDLWRAFKSWCSYRFRYLFGGGVVLLVVWIYVGTPTPDLPAWAWVIGLAAISGIILGFYPVVLAINALWSDENELLVELDPDTGDLAVLELAPDRFDRMTVIDHEGVVRSPSYLHEIRLATGQKAVEVDVYDREHNIAVASWMAGASNRDIRKHRHATSYIKRELSREADKSLDALVNAPEVMRAQGSLIANQLIRVIEGVITPGEGESDVYKRMWDEVQSADVSGELLADHEVEDIDSAIEQFSADLETDDDSDDGSDSSSTSSSGPRRSPRELVADMANGSGGDS